MNEWFGGGYKLTFHCTSTRMGVGPQGAGLACFTRLSWITGVVAEMFVINLESIKTQEGGSMESTQMTCVACKSQSLKFLDKP